MKIYRYTQSCMVVETGGVRILIDPGKDFLDVHEISEVGEVDAVLFTHEHPDHFSKESLRFMCAKNVPCYANTSTSKLADGLNEISDGQQFNVGEVEIAAYDLKHCLLPDGSEGPQNTGFLIDGTFFHPGDGVNLEGLSVDILALPITGPDVSMKDAFQFARQLKTKHVVPVHYDKFGANALIYKQFSENFEMPFEVHVIKDGDFAEISL